MYAYGEKFLPNENVTDGVWVQDSLAMDLGVKTGDKILTIDGEKVKKFSELTLGFVNGNNFQIERNGAIIDKEIPEDFISKLVDRGKNSGAVLLPRYPFAIAEVSEGSPNIGSDIKPKDIVVAINGNPIKYFDEAQTELNKFKNQDISITVKRGSETKEIPVKVNGKGNLKLFEFKHYAK